ncbi:transcriptional regulator, LysR family [Sulfurivirga caldicuralii]|uniref:HTH-type transcriptional regulator MetR n=1 Tax=Sulfurivirga caldicuralii TaxID=364032 RepID=A0A1N6DD11_9GAMM|nr:LysR family transcriptional regulator [Sulfurivirga caldicuralii]SIN68607.1 transcriptional regulator, LysR family [Sulfurivirga caldicuralii]
MIELRHLRTLQALAETGSVSRAAERLNLTQSALSHQLKQLEAQLGFVLFERKSSPLRFTPAGQVLLRTAQSVLPRIEQAQMELRAMASGEAGRLFVAVECHSCFEWLMPVVRDFQARWPQVDLDILPSLTRSALEMLAEHRCELVITSDPQPSRQWVFEPLFSYEQVLVMPSDHRLATRAVVEPDDLAEETLICYPVPEEKLDVFRKFLRPAGVRPKSLRFSELTLMMLQLVDAGRGVCVLPRWLVASQPAFAHLPVAQLGEDGLHSTLYGAYSVHQRDFAPLQDFIATVQKRQQEAAAESA